jgi:hypothetical protein
LLTIFFLPLLSLWVCYSLGFSLPPLSVFFLTALNMYPFEVLQYKQSLVPAAEGNGWGLTLPGKCTTIKLSQWWEQIVLQL